MKIRSTVLGLMLFTSMAAQAQEATLRVEIAGLAEVQGNVVVSVYDNEDDWLGEGVVVTETVDIATALSMVWSSRT